MVFSVYTDATRVIVTTTWANAIFMFDALDSRTFLTRSNVQMSWSATDIANYQVYCFGRLMSYKEEIDCADLALVCLIDFAYKNKLPVKLKYYAGGWKSYSSKDYESVDEFRELITRQLGALNVIDNTKSITIQEAATGDLVMTKWDASLGHTRVIWQVIPLTRSNGDEDYFLYWYQGNLPAVVPYLKGNWWSLLKDSESDKVFEKKPRRWNFAQFG